MTIEELIKSYEKLAEALGMLIDKTEEHMDFYRSSYRFVFLDLMDLMLYKERLDVLEETLRSLKAIKENQ